jgi:hypothetical protein
MLNIYDVSGFRHISVADEWLSLPGQKAVLAQSALSLHSVGAEAVLFTVGETGHDCFAPRTIYLRHYSTGN